MKKTIMIATLWLTAFTLATILLIATAEAEPRQLTVSWSYDSAVPVTGFKVYEVIKGVGGTANTYKLVLTALGSNTRTVTGPFDLTAMPVSFVLTAYDQTNESAYSAEVLGVLSASAKPGIPNGATATIK